MTLNEIDGMKAIMPQIDKSWVDQIIVVDGGSTDGTIQWAQTHGYEVYVQTKKGFRHAYSEVWPLISSDTVITFSPDGNSDPELIPELIAKYRDGYDMVIASRYLPGAGSADDDLVTSFGNWLFTRTINLLHGGSYSDAMVIYRIYHAETPKQLDLFAESSYTVPEKLFRTNISWEPLLSVRAARHGLKIAEIPGFEPARIGGERKLRIIRWGCAYYLQIVREFLQRSPRGN